MINFVIYEDEKKFREKYVSIILKIIGGMKIAYRIVEIEKYESTTLSKLKKLTGKKIYLLDIEVPGKSGLDLAREIRNSGDWLSPMIIITTHDHLKAAAFSGRMLMLDFISKFYNFEESLHETLKLSLNIIESHQSLNFRANGELIQVPYDDILYIEKNIDDMNSTIVTNSEEIVIKKSITSIWEELEQDFRFFKSHRSCIINLNKVTSVELKTCVIRLGEIETPLLSRDKKGELKARLNRKSFEQEEVL